MTAVTLPPPHPLVGGNLWLQRGTRLLERYSVVPVPPYETRLVAGLLVGNHIVDACMHDLPAPLWCNGFEDPLQGVGCGVSYRPISTGQLHGSFVPASTSGLSTQWSGWGPLTHKVYGNLISKQASRLDAFSGYPIRT